VPQRSGCASLAQHHLGEIEACSAAQHHVVRAVGDRQSLTDEPPGLAWMSHRGQRTRPDAAPPDLRFRVRLDCKRGRFLGQRSGGCGIAALELDLAEAREEVGMPVGKIEAIANIREAARPLLSGTFPVAQCRLDASEPPDRGRPEAGVLVQLLERRPRS
jgi:hypothetical protein